MNYCVLVNISKETISFWYQIEGSPYEPLAIREGNVIPLYFYVNSSTFTLGIHAREIYLNGDRQNAFGDFFDIITDPSKHFRIYGNQKQVKYLLYYAVEQYLSHFLNTVLYKPVSIEGVRESFPLRLMYSNDIEQKEKILIEGLFRETGYGNVSTISYSEALLGFLQAEDICRVKEPVVLLTGINGDLYIELYKDCLTNPVSRKILEEQGADPRIRIMAELIYDDVIQVHSYLTLDKEHEVKNLLGYAKSFLEQPTAIPRGEVILSDGTRCNVRIHIKNLNQRLVYYSGEERILSAIDEILTINKLTGNVPVLLNGESVNTNYFLDRLKGKYGNVQGVPAAAESETLKIIFKNIAESGYSTGVARQLSLTPLQSPAIKTPVYKKKDIQPGGSPGHSGIQPPPVPSSAVEKKAQRYVPPPPPIPPRK